MIDMPPRHGVPLADASLPSPDRRLAMRLLVVAPLAAWALLLGACSHDTDEQRHTQADTDRSTMSHGQTEGSGSGMGGGY